MKTFLHPLVVVIIVVLVVIVDDDAFSTFVVSRELVLMISNTFFGALSRGRKRVSVPASESFSMKDPSSWSFSLLLVSDDLLLVREVKLEIDELFWTDTSAAACSEAISAALTSGERDFQESKIVAGNKGEGRFEASSLNGN